jgi:hypothetical protein
METPVTVGYGCMVLESMRKSLVNFRPDNMGRVLTSVIIFSTYSVTLEAGHSKAMDVANVKFPSVESSGYRKIVPCKESDCIISQRVRFKEPDPS